MIIFIDISYSHSSFIAFSSVQIFGNEWALLMVTLFNLIGMYTWIVSFFLVINNIPILYILLFDRITSYLRSFLTSFLIFLCIIKLKIFCLTVIGNEYTKLSYKKLRYVFYIFCIRFVYVFKKSTVFIKNWSIFHINYTFLIIRFLYVFKNLIWNQFYSFSLS